MFSSMFKVQSSRLRRRTRRGNSILEVLFAVLVAVIGLLGAIAVFPVASSQAQKARVLETIATAGRSCVHQFDTAGMRRPDCWWYWNPSPTTLPAYPKFEVINAYTSPPGPGKPTYGYSYCIDSRFVVANAGLSLPAGYDATSFPYVWQDATNPALNNLSLNSPQMARVAFFPPVPTGVAGAAAAPYIDSSGNAAKTIAGCRIQADSIFLIDDDPSYERPKDGSLPGQQNYAALPLAGMGRRQTEGEYSWMATLVPRIDIYSGASTDQYVLSVVMFHKRPADLALNVLDNARTLERTVGAAAADGYTGGEVLLYWTAPQNTANDDLAKDRLKVRPGDWIMLSGNMSYPIGNNQSRTLPRFQWYRVADTEDMVYDGTASQYERWVTLVGQDWSINLAVQQATIVEGVIGVYEKTARLEYGDAL